MTHKVFTKAMKVLIIGTLCIMAFTKDSVMDWLLIGFTASWLIFMAGYMLYKSSRKVDELEAELDDEDNEPEHDEAQPENTSEDTTDVYKTEAWYRMIGSQLLTDSITELNTRGHKHLEITESGDIVVSGNIADSIPVFPDKSQWQTLGKLMRDDGLTVDVTAENIVVSWQEAV